MKQDNMLVVLMRCAWPLSEVGSKGAQPGQGMGSVSFVDNGFSCNSSLKLPGCRLADGQPINVLDKNNMCINCSAGSAAHSKKILSSACASSIASCNKGVNPTSTGLMTNLSLCYYVQCNVIAMAESIARPEKGATLVASWQLAAFGNGNCHRDGGLVMLSIAFSLDLSDVSLLLEEMRRDSFMHLKQRRLGD
jgi:hypothetical protein